MPSYWSECPLPLVRRSRKSCEPGHPTDESTRGHPRAARLLGRVHAAFTIVLIGTTTLGCRTARETVPTRSATEQLLVSTAVDRSLETMEWPITAENRCFLNAETFEGLDKQYALSSVRDQILRAGAKVVSTIEESDVVVELRSGGLSIDSNKVLVGIPSVEVPIPPFGSFTTPEFALFSRARQQGIAKLAYHARRRADGILLHSEPVAFGTSHFTDWTILLIGFTTEDILPAEID